MKAHVLILNYNGAGMLQAYLPSFLIAVKNASHSVKVSVLDNISDDNSASVVAGFKGEVGWVTSKKNEFLCSYNSAALCFDEDILVFMNNDICLDPGCLDPLIEPFASNEDVFMTSPTFLSIDGKAIEGAKAIGGIQWGLFWSKSVLGGAASGRYPTPELTAGMGAVDRNKFITLGGYDPLYLPGTFEDVDLCFRAWQRGWATLHIPQSRVYHMGQASFKKKFGAQGIRVINSRNLFFFMWKNIRDPFYIAEHLLLTIPRILWSLARGRTDLLTGFIQALHRFPEAMSKRKGVNAVFSERKIFKIIK